MRLHYKGKFNGDFAEIPTREHEANYVKFDEPDNLEKFSNKMTIISLIMTAIGVLFFKLYTGSFKYFDWKGPILALVTLLPHELLHAICFKEDVFLFTNFKKGMLFVTGTENMTKSRFIFMSLLPNIVFGFIPFLIFLLNRDLYLLGSMSAFTIGMGAGDYYNVYNVIKQMPNKSCLYSIGYSTYWFFPNNKREL